jgi:hypothetical protein
LLKAGSVSGGSVTPLLGHKGAGALERASVRADHGLDRGVVPDTGISWMRTTDSIVYLILPSCRACVRACGAGCRCWWVLGAWDCQGHSERDVDPAVSAGPVPINHAREGCVVKDADRHGGPSTPACPYSSGQIARPIVVLTGVADIIPTHKGSTDNVNRVRGCGFLGTWPPVGGPGIGWW